MLDALARIDPLPSITGSRASVAAPSPETVRLPRCPSCATRSVVRVLGTACGLGIEGSGWAAGPDQVVTNAHVVAGESDTTVEAGRARYGTRRRTGGLFDPADDLAILRVRGLGLPALLAARSDPASGSRRGDPRLPENGPFDGSRRGSGDPASRHAERVRPGPGDAPLTPVRGLVRPGNSGGPVSTGPAGC